MLQVMVCPAGDRPDWLSPARDGEFCSHCDRTVHDLSRLDAAQANALLEQRDEQGRTPCVAVRTNRRGEVLLRQGVAAMALAAITACAPWGDETWDEPMNDEAVDACVAAHERDPYDMPPMCDGLFPSELEPELVGVVGGIPGGTIGCAAMEAGVTRGAVARIGLAAEPMPTYEASVSHPPQRDSAETRVVGNLMMTKRDVRRLKREKRRRRRAEKKLER